MTNYKISHKSLRNSSFKSFQFFVLPVFILDNVINKQLTTSENIPPQRREVVVSVDGNYFYRAIVLWKDEISDEKHKEIPR